MTQIKSEISAAVGYDPSGCQFMSQMNTTHNAHKYILLHELNIEARISIDCKT